MMRRLSLDGVKMKELTSKTPSAEVAAMTLAMRERKRHEININRMKAELSRSHEKINDSDYLQYWKDLEKEGLGNLVFGRLGNDIRFFFRYDPRAIGRAGVQGTNEKAEAVVPMRRSRSKRASVNRVYSPQFKRNEVGAPVIKGLSTKPFRLSIDMPDDINEGGLRLILDTIKKVSNYS